MMTAVHDALRRELDQLLHTTASDTPSRARWIVFRDQLHYHPSAEETAMWPLARAKLTGDPHGQALLDAMADEHQLIGPLLALTDDAFTLDTDPGPTGPLNHIKDDVGTSGWTFTIARQRRAHRGAVRMPASTPAPGSQPGARFGGAR